jgi:required for meiotic nuclear division protein 1
MKVVAFQVAERLNIKHLKDVLKYNLISDSSTELFYRDKDKDSYLYILSYGVVVFANFDETDITKFIAFIGTNGYCDKKLDSHFKEDITIFKDKKTLFTYDEAYIPKIVPNAVRIIMLNVAQSVLLDYYQSLTESLLSETSSLTNELEKFGKLQISEKSLVKFIGKTLNIKNRIFDNLYIFDVPDLVWENEYLDKVNEGMSRTFDINTRFKEIEYALRIIENNLDIFTELARNRTSTRMELTIIGLIAFEIIYSLFEYFTK